MSLHLVDSIGHESKIRFANAEAAIQFSNPSELENVILEEGGGLLWDYEKNTWVDLWKEIKRKSTGVKFFVSVRESTPKRMLSALANDGNEFVRKRVARNRNTSSDTLYNMSKDSDYSIRFYVAMNPITPEDVLVTLANDPHWEVRRAVAWNDQTPLRVLQMLAEDKHKDSAENLQQVRKAAKKHDTYKAWLRSKT